MKQVKATITGLTKGVSKKGSPYMMIYVTKPFSETQTANGALGLEAKSYFVPEELRERIPNSAVGKSVTLFTVFAGNQDNLADITVS